MSIFSTLADRLTASFKNATRLAAKKLTPEEITELLAKQERSSEIETFIRGNGRTK